MLAAVFICTFCTARRSSASRTGQVSKTGRTECWLQIRRGHGSQPGFPRQEDRGIKLGTVALSAVVRSHSGRAGQRREGVRQWQHMCVERRQGKGGAHVTAWLCKRSARSPHAPWYPAAGCTSHIESTTQSGAYAQHGSQEQDFRPSLVCLTAFRTPSPSERPPKDWKCSSLSSPACQPRSSTVPVLTGVQTTIPNITSHQCHK